MNVSKLDNKAKDLTIPVCVTGGKQMFSRRKLINNYLTQTTAQENFHI